MIIQNAITHRLGTVALAAAILGACSQHTTLESAANGEDAVAAYEALSAKLQPCADKAKACVTEANNDQAKLKACGEEVKSCHQSALAEQQQAQSALQQAVTGCFEKARTCAPAGGAGGATTAAREACGTQLRACLKDNAPPLPPCLQKLQACVQAPAAAASAAAGAGAAANAHVEQLVGCVKEAHTCIMDSLPELPTRGGAGAGAPFFHPHAGAPAFPHAGAPAFPHAGAPAFPRHDD